MSNLIYVFTNFLENIVNLDLFMYFLASVAFIGVCILIRKIVYIIY